MLDSIWELRVRDMKYNERGLVFLCFEELQMEEKPVVTETEKENWDQSERKKEKRRHGERRRTESLSLEVISHHVGTKYDQRDYPKDDKRIDSILISSLTDSGHS